MWNLLRRNNNKLESQSVDLNDYFKPDTDSILSSDEDVLKHPLVRRGISLIADLAATLPINVYIDGGTKGREVDSSHPYQYRLNVRPSPYSDRFTWIQTIVKDAIVFGNSYSLITKDGFLRLDPITVTPEIKNSQLVFNTTINDIPRTLSQDEVIHIRSLTNDGIQGVSLADSLLDSMAAGLSMYKHIRRFFENGTFSSLVWTLPPSARQGDKAKAFQEKVEAKYSGIGNAFKNIFIGEGGKIEPLQSNNQINQTAELLEFDIIVVAAALGLPPSALGSNQNTSFKSLEIEDKKTLRDINPWLIQIEQQFTSKLMTEDDLRTGKRWIEFNRKAAVEMDSDKEMKLLTDGLTSGIYSLEFVRRKLNAPINNIDGETYYLPYTVQDVSNDKQDELTVAHEYNANKTKEEEEEEPDSRFHAITKQTLTRLITRIAKDNKPAMSHKKIWNENLNMFNESTTYLRRLGNLIDGSSESRQEIANNIDVELWTTELLKNDTQI